MTPPSEGHITHEFAAPVAVYALDQAVRLSIANRAHETNAESDERIVERAQRFAAFLQKHERDESPTTAAG